MSSPLRIDTLEIDGMTARVSYFYDSDSDAPWDNCDGHGPVRKSRHRHSYGNSDKRPGERPMNRASSNEYQFYYDWQAAMKIAEKDGWNAEPYEAPGRALRAVESDFKFLKAWVNDEWQYVGVKVEMLDEDGELTHDFETMWGVETWKDYHEECAKEMAEALVKSHKEDLAKAALQERIDNRYRDAMNLGVLEAA